ncbi:MAG: carboxypeptidase-like regulatory domain-containing protein, partial [Bacteroidia bacterium]|nr:carboxypeptidase-like regulatory domain-containing protein [Bacteroidia bacterium]
MVNRYILTLILLAGSVTVSFCQTVTVLFADDKQPVPFAHIFCKDLKTFTEQVYLSDTAGNVIVDQNSFPTGKLQVSISFMGYKKITDTITGVQNKTYYLESENISLNEVVVTAQYAPGSADKSVHKVKIIDSKKIEAMGAQNLRDVLTNEMNIRISQDNVLGSSMSLQGVSGQNVKILIDGIPVTGRLNGNIDISQ